MVRWTSVVIALALPLVLSACGANRYCLVEQEYQRAEVASELQPAEGLSLPESPSALRLPPAPAKPVPFGVANAKGVGNCLDKPPRLAAKPVAPPAAAKTPAAS